MKTKELEKLFKDRLVKDGIDKKWMNGGKVEGT